MFDWLTIAILLFAAAIHASFQLGIGMLLLLSSHSLGARRKHTRTLWLNLVYIGGFFVTTALLLALLALFFRLSLPAGTPYLLLALAGALNFGVGIAVILFYYRTKTGTELWIGKSMSTHMKQRAKKASGGADAIALSVSAVGAELLLALAPLSFAAILLLQQPPQIVAMLLPLYVAIVSAPLVAVAILIGGGHKVSTLQAWREKNRRFLQVMTGIGLIILAIYTYAIYIAGDSAFSGVNI